MGVGVACGVAPPVASGAESGAGLGSDPACAVGGGETAGLDATEPYVAPTATSTRPARAIRRHHARMCPHPPEPAPGRPRILVERAERTGRARRFSTGHEVTTGRQRRQLPGCDGRKPVRIRIDSRDFSHLACAHAPPSTRDRLDRLSRRALVGIARRKQVTVAEWVRRTLRRASRSHQRTIDAKPCALRDRQGVTPRNSPPPISRTCSAREIESS